MRKSHIPQDKAFEYINYYKNTSPSGALQSAWLNKEFIDFTINAMKNKDINGLRVYMAKYTEDDSGGQFKKDDITVILVPTINDIAPSGGIDVADGCFDYSNPCPPTCNK